MIVLSNTTAQTLTVGQSITFDRVVLKSGCAECHKEGTNSVKMRCNGIYEVHFSGNIGGSDDEIQLALAVGGVILPETTMRFGPGTDPNFYNVSTATAIRNCCYDYDRITVVNSGVSPLTVDANALLFVKRVS